jgi:hypothetical protein
MFHNNIVELSAITSTRNAMPIRGWKACPLKDLQDPHTLHPVAKLEHLHIPKVAPDYTIL